MIMRTANEPGGMGLGCSLVGDLTDQVHKGTDGDRFLGSVLLKETSNRQIIGRRS